ncbi:hypothetical protein Barb6XT_00269 [Bacteroidales bacterium Barb6XT]|nr:hypothetical protein Barb6XT_00269 [Bacteroidales bacterium Barb6XT]
MKKFIVSSCIFIVCALSAQTNESRLYIAAYTYDLSGNMRSVHDQAYGNEEDKNNLRSAHFQAYDNEEINLPPEKPTVMPPSFAYDNSIRELQFRNMKGYRVSISNTLSGSKMDIAIDITQDYQRIERLYDPGIYVMRAVHNMLLEYPPLSLQFLVR